MDGFFISHRNRGISQATAFKKWLPLLLTKMRLLTLLENPLLPFLSSTNSFDLFDIPTCMAHALMLSSCLAKYFFRRSCSSLSAYKYSIYQLFNRSAQNHIICWNRAFQKRNDTKNRNYCTASSSRIQLLCTKTGCCCRYRSQLPWELCQLQ